jgi:hypothetical protein
MREAAKIALVMDIDENAFERLPRKTGKNEYCNIITKQSKML